MSIAARERPETLRCGLLKPTLLFIALYFPSAFVEPVAGGQIENR